MTFIKTEYGFVSEGKRALVKNQSPLFIFLRKGGNDNGW